MNIIHGKKPDSSSPKARHPYNVDSTVTVVGSTVFVADFCPDGHLSIVPIG